MDSQKSDKPEKIFHVIAVPFPGRGDINPIINLCRSLASISGNIINFSFVVTEEWLHLMTSSGSVPACIKFASLPNDLLPSEHVRATDLLGFFDAVMTKLETPFEQLLDGIQPPPHLLLADNALSWAVRVGNRRNIPVASFCPMSASMFSVFYHFSLLELNGDFPVDVSVRGNSRVEYIPGLSSTRLVDILSPTGGTYDYFLQNLLEAFSLLPKVQHLFFSTVYELEHGTIDALRAAFHIPIYTIGPEIPEKETSNSEEDYFLWLNQQKENSVLYVSLGSHLSVSDTQMDEFLDGLDESGVPFMLVARSKTDEFLKKDCGFEKGLIVEWCNQFRVLSHKSIGGFWSHCGWNSVKEGVMAGVPFITAPIIADQFLNSKLVVEDWNIGVRLKEEVVKTETVVTRQEVAEIVRKFMDSDSYEVKEMRKRARMLQKDVLSGRDGSSPANDLVSFIKNISSP